MTEKTPMVRLSPRQTCVLNALASKPPAYLKQHWTHCTASPPDLLRITNERFNGLMNEKAEYVRLVKSRDRQIKKLYQEIDDLRKQGGAA